MRPSSIVRAGFEPLHTLLTGEPIETLCQIAERERQRLIRECEATKDSRRLHYLREELRSATNASLGGGQ